MGFVQAILRGSQFLWTLLATALIGNAIAEAFAGNPATVNYSMFVCVFSWIALFFGIAALFVTALPWTALLALDALATLFTFIAGVVLAAKLGVHSCGNKHYVDTNELTNGSHHPSQRCHELQASTAFFWFLFASFAASIAFDFIERGGSSMGRGRRGTPAMSQV